MVLNCIDDLLPSKTVKPPIKGPFIIKNNGYRKEWIKLTTVTRVISLFKAIKIQKNVE
jgi:hypothetical protein